MKTKFLVLGLATLIFGFGVNTVAAQMMGGNNGTGYNMMGDYQAADAKTTSAEASSTDSAEAKGAALWTKFTAHKITCADLTNDDFDALGDFFMGNMMGTAHEAMDQYMSNTIGATGDEQMHIAMGERITGCNTSAAYPAGVTGFGPMMMGGNGFGYGMMDGYDSAQYRPGYRAVNGNGLTSWYMLGFSVLLWGLALFGFLSLIRLAVRK